MTDVKKVGTQPAESHTQAFRSFAPGSGDPMKTRLASYKAHSNEEGEWVTREEGS